MDMASLTNKGRELVTAYAPKLALAIITLIIGLWVIKGISAWSISRLKAMKVDKFYLLLSEI